MLRIFGQHCGNSVTSKNTVCLRLAVTKTGVFGPHHSNLACDHQPVEVPLHAISTGNWKKHSFTNKIYLLSSNLHAAGYEVIFM